MKYIKFTSNRNINSVLNRCISIYRKLDVVLDIDIFVYDRGVLIDNDFDYIFLKVVIYNTYSNFDKGFIDESYKFLIDRDDFKSLLNHFSWYRTREASCYCYSVKDLF